MSPKISVVIPAYNAAYYIGACLKSMIDQSFKDQEIVVIDDASTDDSVKVVRSFQDPRIRLIENASNLGLAACVNKAIRSCAGEYIARMDADDIAHPTRLEKQLMFMEANPEIGIVGSAMQSVGHSNFLHRFPASHAACKAQLLFNVCFGHPTVMIRRSVFLPADSLYREELQQYSEEYELWCRLVDRIQFANMQEVLLQYRTFDPQMKSEAQQKRRVNSFAIRKAFIASQLGETSDGQLACHDHICNLDRAGNVEELLSWINWLFRCAELNYDRRAFDPAALNLELSRRLFEICYWNAHLGWAAFRAWSEGLRRLPGFKPDVKQRFKFLIRCLLRRSEKGVAILSR